MIRLHRPRGRALVASGAALAAVCLASPSAALADTNPYPNNPYYFSANELPDIGTPFEVSRDPAVSAGMDYLQSGEPSCPAPAPLAGTDASSPDGYTVPVQIKVTNGIMLAGYSPAAAYWKQPVPFSLRLRGLTGWVNARVQLPSMKMLVDPTDVTFCEGAHLGIANALSTVATPAHSDWAPWDSPDSWYPETQPDGSAFVPPPGTFDSMFYSDLPGARNRLDVENLKVKSVGASLTGIASNGDLQLAVTLDLDLDLVRADGLGTFPLGVRGTFSTAVKSPFAPGTANVPWDVGSPLPEKHASYLPTRTLPGAVEGGTTTVGSTEVDIDVTRLNDITDPLTTGLATALYNFMYGVDPWGIGIVDDDPDATQFWAWSAAVADHTARYFPPDRGVADVSADMTIDRLGLPKGVPSGFGFDG